MIRPGIALILMTSVTLHAAPDREASAYLIDLDEIAWSPPEVKGGRLALHAGGESDPQQAQVFPLMEIAAAARAPLPPDLAFLAPMRRFRVAGPENLDLSRLKGRLVVAVWEGTRQVAATGLQTFPAIDRRLAYEGEDLGVTFVNRAPRFRVWAPTARSVRLLLFDSAEDMEPELAFPMKAAESGTWTAAGTSEWAGRAYLYEVEVYVRRTGKVEINRVTDPYSVAVTTNGRLSLAVDLADPALMPAGWEAVAPRTVEDPVDLALYELHVRDFSAFDPMVPDGLRGTYPAFDLEDSHGVRHLKALAGAGMTHVHMLPCFDFATVNEDRSSWKHAEIPADVPGDSPLPQQEIARVQREDGYNWGYDPAHWGVPEGSYATVSRDATRVREFRQMVKGLDRLGLGLVMDVVYNHTHAAGQGERSGLDPLVPDYYYRLDAHGNHQSTSCCPDTASEHRMMEKLMIDTLLRWVLQYKVSGFRFDLMGHHTRSNMEKFRRALDALTLETHGVDGRRIPFYGEGWRFGSLDAILPARAMHQQNARGSGVGTFNDRIRDCLRGGDFTMATRHDQGLVDGLADDPNGAPDLRLVPVEASRRRDFLEREADCVRLGMAGNLADFFLPGPSGPRRGKDVTYRTQPGCGYAADPRETVNYVAAHDNGTLFDHLMAKAPRAVQGREPATASREDLVRMQVLGLGVIALSQGVPFFHAGDEILRSKSGDWDSYESGDWFNRLDFTCATNNWGVGLPPREKNRDHWEFWKPRLTDPAWRMGPEQIRACFERFKELLKIRRSTPLLRLRTGAEVISRLTFLDRDAAEAHPGLIAFEIADRGTPSLDPERAGLIVVVNSHRGAVRFAHPALSRGDWRLHPVLAASADPELARLGGAPVKQAISVPGRTIVVLEEPR